MQQGCFFWSLMLQLAWFADIACSSFKSNLRVFSCLLAWQRPCLFVLMLWCTFLPLASHIQRFFWAPASLFNCSQWGEIVCSSRRLHGEKAQRPASFFQLPCLFCGATLSASKFKISELFRKALVMSLVLFSNSSRSVGTQRWRRSWCWSSRCAWSCTICPTKNIRTERGKCVCVFVCSSVAHSKKIKQETDSKSGGAVSVERPLSRNCCWGDKSIFSLSTKKAMWTLNAAFWQNVDRRRLLACKHGWKHCGFKLIKKKKMALRIHKILREQNKHKLKWMKTPQPPSTLPGAQTTNLNCLKWKMEKT